MPYFSDLEEKIHFMVLEVNRQLDDTQKIIQDPKPDLVDKVKSRDDRIDNYKAIIENLCFSRIHGEENLTKKQVDFIRATNIISNNLEKISDFSVYVVDQLNYLSSIEYLHNYNYQSFFQHLSSSLDIVVQGLFTRDLNHALNICRTEFVIDKLFKRVFDQIIEELDSAENKQNIITCLFIFRYLERMGDAMLNIGEAIIFSVFGEKLKIHQYQALVENLDSINNDISIKDVGFESIWESRSGCRIGKVMDSSREGTQAVLFKEGKAGKISREKENIETWKRIFPSLVPKVFSYTQSRNSASMLLEFLPGCSLQEAVLSQDRDTLENALFILKETLSFIWKDTLKNKQVNSGFMNQLAQRIDDVLMIHPEFNFSQASIGSLMTPSLEEVIRILREVESELKAPFCIFIHGDFNTNNIIYNQKEQQIYFIDLHRSCYGDYVQDVSVFLVSNYRKPVFDAGVRRLTNRLNQDFFNFSRRFAAENADETFDARLAMGLIRSFFTSTRFELNQEFALGMYQRALYLAEKIIAHRGNPWREFAMPPDVFKYSSF
ncbi:PhoU domain-containing protein [Desulfonatronospira sp.]|uniref:PhoU domain-containing protein n=1 Tax=Desulfonatronospira sp. TaxID=1962951 RepID=UPI0025B96634|nr:PhoU domain-containing protein [Desulfonatronospira sp.]